MFKILNHVLKVIKKLITQQPPLKIIQGHSIFLTCGITMMNFIRHAGSTVQ